jgi:hypothetical protein
LSGSMLANGSMTKRKRTGGAYWEGAEEPRRRGSKSKGSRGRGVEGSRGGFVARAAFGVDTIDEAPPALGPSTPGPLGPFLPQ